MAPKKNLYINLFNRMQLIYLRPHLLSPEILRLLRLELRDRIDMEDVVDSVLGWVVDGG
jgi:hypothetical protein